MRVHLRELQKAFPDFALGQSPLGGGRFLYHQPAGAVLVGYLVDFPPSGPRLWALRMPLYEYSETLHLSYSGQIATFHADGERFASRSFEEMLAAASNRKRWNAATERSFAERVAAIIREDEPRLDERQDLKALATFLGPRSDRDWLMRKSLAATQIMLGSVEEAKRLLLTLPRDHLRTPERDEDIERMLRTIKQGAGAALEDRRRVADVMRQRLGLSA